MKRFCSQHDALSAPSFKTALPLECHCRPLYSTARCYWAGDAAEVHGKDIVRYRADTDSEDDGKSEIADEPETEESLSHASIIHDRGEKEICEATSTYHDSPR